MAMTVGTASMTLASSGLVVTATYAGSGMALALIQARGPAFLTSLNASLSAAAAAGANAQPPFTSLPATAANPSFPSLAGYQAGATTLAVAAVADANAIVPYIQANATAVVSTSLGGLQNGTSPPTAQRTIPIS